MTAGATEVFFNKPCPFGALVCTFWVLSHMPCGNTYTKDRGKLNCDLSPRHFFSLAAGCKILDPQYSSGNSYSVLMRIQFSGHQMITDCHHMSIRAQIQTTACYHCSQKILILLIMVGNQLCIYLKSNVFFSVL